MFIDAGDKLVEVLSKFDDPYIVLFGGFLDDSECDILIDLAKPRVTRSLTTTGLHESRTSYGTFLGRGETETVKIIEDRISKVINWPVDHGENIQILRYLPGAEYKPHYDYFDVSLPESSELLKRGGQRLGTLIMYLSDTEEGGCTVFPDINLRVKPKRGNALFFRYKAEASSKTLHGGEPVIVGEKWIATKWLREHIFL